MAEKKTNKKFKIPKNSLVIIVGIPGSGKTALAKKVTQKNGVIISANEIRKQINGDSENQENGDLVFSEFHKKISSKLKEGKLVVADAASINPVSRQKLYKLGIMHKRPIRVLVMNIPLHTVLEWNKRKGNKIKEDVVIKMHKFLEESYKTINNEIYTLRKDGIDIKACDIVEKTVDEEIR